MYLFLSSIGAYPKTDRVGMEALAGWFCTGNLAPKPSCGFDDSGVFSPL